MVRKRVDERVRRFIEEGVALEQRSLVVLVGDYGKDQVVNLHAILSKARVRARPSVLWCYKKELGFSTHRKKRMKAIKKQIARGLHDATDEPFELFISQTDIRWCYYRDTHKILGATYGTLVLQDFEALTPNLLARTIETVEGGGLVVVLLRTVKSLKQLYAMSMDVHARFRGSATRGECVPRFNERFILSLADCRAGKESEIPNFKGSSLGRFPLVSADFWTSDHLSERSRSMDAFHGTLARGTLTLKRR
jgi:N-acetyltransferase 10